MPSTARSLNPFRTLIQHRNFRIFWIGQTLSLMGTWMQTMAQGWLALQLSNSAFIVGLVSTIGSLPVLALSLPAGVVTDRVNKLTLVTICQACLLLEATGLWAATATHRITIPLLLGLAAFNGIASAFEIPARQSLMIELVGRDDLHDAIALNSSGFNLARIIGPATGAVVIATFGTAACFLLNAVSYLAVLAGLFLIRLPPWIATPHPSPIDGMREGLRYMAKTPTIAALIRLITVSAICGIPYLTLMPVVARDLLHAGAAGYGVLLACVGIGGLAGALFLASVGARFPRRGRLLAFSTYGFALLLIGFSLSRSEWLSRVVLLGCGFMMILNGALLNGLLQSIVPDALRGRLMSVYSLIAVGVSQVVGSFIAGAVANTVGVDWAIGGFAAVMLAYAYYAFSISSAIRRL